MFQFLIVSVVQSTEIIRTANNNWPRRTFQQKQITPLQFHSNVLCEINELALAFYKVFLFPLEQSLRVVLYTCIMNITVWIWNFEGPLSVLSRSRLFSTKSKQCERRAVCKVFQSCSKAVQRQRQQHLARRKSVRSLPNQSRIGLYF